MICRLDSQAKTMEEERVISQGRTLPAEEPAVVAVPPLPPVPPVPPVGDVFDDEPASFNDYAILALPASSYGSVLGDDNEGNEAYVDTSDSDSDSSEIEDHDNQVRFWDSDAARSETDLVAEPLMFLGQMTRFASFQGAAGFMRMSATQASTGGEDNHESGVILVHYRLTRFSGTQNGGLIVYDFGTDLHHPRYLVPFPVAAIDPVSSLRLVGAALAANFYPYRYYVQLQALWSSLVAVLPVHMPPRTMRVVVTVDFGVLRSEDRTPERMERMRAALAALARENDATSPMDFGLEQHLPVPVCCDEPSSGGEVARPANRRRFNVEGEVCAICQEKLLHGLAAWPRCSHIFHGKCLEQLLVTVLHRCPICRSTL